MNIVEATHGYQNWLAQQLALDDLAIDIQALGVKHDQMAGSPSSLLRATFYRWVQLWPAGQKAWRDAPQLLAVGDLHIENFGTWRDAEGRLVWGVNDFDEACQLPYTNDLVRLSASARLTIDANRYPNLKFRTACRQILTGYEQTLRNGKEAASPLVLSEANDWLREIAALQVRDPARFWNKLDHVPPTDGQNIALANDIQTASAAKSAARADKSKPKAKAGKQQEQEAKTRALADAAKDSTSGTTVASPADAVASDAVASDAVAFPADALPDGATALKVGVVPIAGRQAIESQLPPGFQTLQWKRRQAGLGSLGRPRFVALGNWQGARLAREGKALVPSAALWEQGKAKDVFVTQIMAGAVRCPDPHFTVCNHWLVRRLAPDCAKLELSDVPRRQAEQFLFAMGREIANIHLGSREAVPAVLKHLKTLPDTWLEDAAQQCVARVLEDWTRWRQHHSPARGKK